MHGRSSDVCPQGRLPRHEAAPRSEGGADLLQQGSGHRGSGEVLGELAEPDPPRPGDGRWDVVLPGQPDLGLCPLCSGGCFLGAGRGILQGELGTPGVSAAMPGWFRKLLRLGDKGL